jgi:hypothetical protein
MHQPPSNFSSSRLPLPFFQRPWLAHQISDHHFVVSVSSPDAANLSVAAYDTRTSVTLSTTVPVAAARCVRSQVARCVLTDHSSLAPPPTPAPPPHAPPPHPAVKTCPPPPHTVCCILRACACSVLLCWGCSKAGLAAELLHPDSSHQPTQEAWQKFASHLSGTCCCVRERSVPPSLPP